MAAKTDGAKSVIRAVPQTQWELHWTRADQFWQRLLNSGRIASLAIDPRSNNTVYAGAAEGGVWKTTDGGQYLDSAHRQSAGACHRRAGDRSV